jgi:hypothetical protein
VRPFRIRSRYLDGEPNPPPKHPISDSLLSSVAYVPSSTGSAAHERPVADRESREPAAEAPTSPSTQSPTRASRQAPRSISDEMIAVRAYEIWERRGRPHGDNERDWFAAREELEQERDNGAYRPVTDPSSPR